MFVKLYKIHKNNIGEQQASLISSQVELAESFWARARGLLGREQLVGDHVLWIKPCNNIHTLFMKMTIDCIFIDQKYIVQKIYKGVKPFRIAGPVWKAYSVIEAQSGFVDKWQLQSGDQLHVVS